MRYSPHTHEPTPDVSPRVAPLSILVAGKQSVGPVAAEPNFYTPRQSAIQRQGGEQISM